MSPRTDPQESEKQPTLDADLDALLDFARRHLELDERDTDWTRNRLLALLDLDSYVPSDRASARQSTGQGSTAEEITDLLAAFCRDAHAAGVFTADQDAAVTDRLMGQITRSPSQVADRFAAVEAEKGSMAAMRWLYDYGIASTYIKKTDLDRNPRFESQGLIITINQAKPEFRTMAKAAAGNRMGSGYPACTICRTNEGFAGRGRSTLRTLGMTLGGHPWFWQFSPYGYFDQHGICVNAEHRPMRVDRETFGNLLDFVDRFPGYFLGCNAALPGIGGSVLAHDHYQGGGEILPLHKAPARMAMSLPGTSGMLIEIPDWPGTAIRLIDHDREAIIEVSDLIRRGWIDYSDEALNIRPQGPRGRQSALSPSVLITERGYEMNLILRNNGVSEQYPDGIFHVHPEFYAIKQEPIGLIEAQGLFVLPGRLVPQLTRLARALEDGEDLPESLKEFRNQWDELTAMLGGSRDPQQIRSAIRRELGDVCKRILGNTAVFKDPMQTRAFLLGLGFIDR